MATGLGATAANQLLDWMSGTASVAGPGYSWVQLHLTSPGAAGTSGGAANTTRKQVTEASASGGSKASSADLVWTSVSTAETYAFQTRWTASTAGVFGFSGTVTANAVAVGDTFTIPSGSETSSFTLAS